jgi:hypothetical protein
MGSTVQPHRHGVQPSARTSTPGGRGDHWRRLHLHGRGRVLAPEAVLGRAGRKWDKWAGWRPRKGWRNRTRKKMGERGQRAGWRETSRGRGAGLVRRAGLREQGGPGEGARAGWAAQKKRGAAGWASAAGWAAREKGGVWASLFPILLSFIFSISYCYKSNSLLNACFTSSLIKQNESTLHHDATIKAPLGFYFTRFTYIKQNSSPLFEKKVEKKESKRVTPEFGGY